MIHQRSILFLFLLISYSSFSQPSTKSISKVLGELNELRSKGCNCGGTYMPPVESLKWNETLYKVSSRYAKYLYRHNLFSHKALDGSTLGDRLDRIGYDWQRIGENLGKGYYDFYDVLEAWKESPSHCKMLMDPDVTHVGMSKHYDYWVQTFSKPLILDATY